MNDWMLDNVWVGKEEVITQNVRFQHFSADFIK